MQRTFQAISIPALALLEKAGATIEGERPYQVQFPDGTDTKTDRGRGWGNLTITTYTLPNGRQVLWDSESNLLESDRKGE